MTLATAAPQQQSAREAALAAALGRLEEALSEGAAV